MRNRLNGPFASNNYDNDNVSDYSIGKNLIYFAIEWSLAEQVYKFVGFFDVSSDNGGKYFPMDEKLDPIDNPSSSNKGTKTKPWWKIW